MRQPIVFSNIFLVLCWSILLGPTTSAQNILVGGKTPKDLQITIDDTGTIQFANYQRFTISSEGFVTVEYTRRGLPSSGGQFSTLLLLRKNGNSKKVRPQKPAEKKDRVSERQLIDLARAIESSTFFQMQDSYHGDSTLELGTCVDHAGAKAISVTANGRTKNVYFFLGCTYGEYEPLKKFLELYKRIETVVGGVKVKEIEPERR